MFSEAAVWVSSATSDSSSPMYTSFLSAATNTNYQEQTQPLRHDSHQCIFLILPKKNQEYWGRNLEFRTDSSSNSLDFPNFVWLRKLFEIQIEPFRKKFILGEIYTSDDSA